MTAVSRQGKTFVGFGFGPIQGGVFLYEAWRSGNFSRLVVAEVDAELVAAVRGNGEAFRLNVARTGGVERVTVGPVEVYDPNVPADRAQLVRAVGEADEMATALPSVRFYDTPGAASVVGILGDGLRCRPQPRATVIYAAENHNRAAQILGEMPGLGSVQVLNTVIGKMSGVIDDRATIDEMELATVTPNLGRAVLVEAFNRILISKVHLAGYRRGIEVFQEKADLLPFEEAKLYGHNAVHATIAYLAELKGYRTMAQAGGDEEIMARGRRGFIEESGGAMLRRHGAVEDELFTPAGYEAYADDLLERMVNPHLNDLVWRVGRDHVRKLGYADRLFGTMGLALACGIQPTELARGAAAGVVSMIRRRAETGVDVPGSREALAELLGGIWGARPGGRAEELVSLTWEAMRAILPRSGNPKNA